MRILFLAHLFPLPLDSGGKIKTFHTLKALAREHEIHLLSYVRLDDEYRLVKDMQDVCASVEIIRLERGKARHAAELLAGLCLRRSFIVSRDYRRKMQAAFERALTTLHPDVVHVDHLQMAQFVPCGQPYKTVLDQHNVESAIIRRTADTDESFPRRLYASMEWPKLQRYEIRTCQNCDIVLTVSDEDGRALRKTCPSLTNLRTVPIGADIHYFQPLDRDHRSRNLLFVGTMYWPPNIDSVLFFYKEIFPRVRKLYPDCSLTIAGQRPTSTIRALENDPAVRVAGYVDDVREISRDCGAFIVPLRSGSGVRVKILNALAMGLPVISTSLGAEGLDVSDGEHLLIADTAEDFAQAISNLFGNPELANTLSENGRRLVCERYSWEVVGDRLLSIYRHDLESHKPGL